MRPQIRYNLPRIPGPGIAKGSLSYGNPEAEARFERHRQDIIAVHEDAKARWGAYHAWEERHTGRRRGIRILIPW